MFNILKKRYLPLNIVMLCLSYYENHDIFLTKDACYESKKCQLLGKHRISYDSFTMFIEQTRKNKFSNFKRLHSISSKLAYNFNNDLEYDFCFGECIYVKPNLWSKNAYSALLELITKHQNKSILIIDLRNLNGGYLHQSIKICNMLLPECEIVTLKYKDKIVKHISNAEHFKFKKIFVLVNNLSMSSAEILAFSLKSNLSTTILLGCETFGKNFGQEVFKNKKYKFELTIPAFEWSTSGTYSQDIVSLSDDELFLYIKSNM